MKQRWLPIRTVPRDGSVVHVAVPGEETALMRWVVGGSNALFQPEPIGIWETSDGSLTWSEQRGYGPTHWMPAQ